MKRSLLEVGGLVQKYSKERVLGLSKSLRSPQEYLFEKSNKLIMFLVRPQIFETSLKNKHWPMFPEPLPWWNLANHLSNKVKHSVEWLVWQDPVDLQLEGTCILSQVWIGKRGRKGCTWKDDRGTKKTGSVKIIQTGKKVLYTHQIFRKWFTKLISTLYCLYFQICFFYKSNS